MHVLIVEDDPVIGKTINKGLTEAGHECVLVRDGQLGLEKALAEPFDAIVLDIMLPTLNGLDLLKTLRSQKNRTPVLLLTALGTVDERVNGLQAGGDDYLVKPFAFEELLARLEAIYRRAGTRPAPTAEAAGLKLDLTNRRVMHGSNEIDLTPTEFSLLEFLMRHDGRVVTRKMLCEHLWDADWEGETNVIEVHINRLRGKIERAGAGTPITTVRGRGYVLRGE